MLDKDSAVRFAKFKINTRPNAIISGTNRTKAFNKPAFSVSLTAEQPCYHQSHSDIRYDTIEEFNVDSKAEYSA